MSAQPFAYGQGKKRPKFSQPRNPVTTGTPRALAACAVLIMRSVPNLIFSSFVPLQMASVSLPYGPSTIWPSGWLARAEMMRPRSLSIFSDGLRVGALDDLVEVQVRVAGERG